MEGRRPRPRINERAALAERQFRAANGPAQPTPSMQEAEPSPARHELDRILLALLPLRLFLGVTFLYAGLDKLVDPLFLRASGVGSIGQQLLGFTRSSPLTPLINAVALPQPVLIGWLIAIAEIAIGLGALLGLLYRLSAVGGAAVSIMFFLTASWTTHPYYYCPDLPYAAGWATLAFVGRPGPFSADAWFAAAAARVAASLSGRRRREMPEPSGLDWVVPVSNGRRALLKAMVLGAVAVVLAGAGGVLGALRGADDFGGESEGSRGGIAGGGSGGVSGSQSPLPSDTTGATGGGSGASAAPSAQDVIARLDQIQPRQALDFQDPLTGDPGVLVRLADGKCVAYDAICTHAGCTVGYDAPSGLLVCPCHGAAFDPTNKASVVGGPTNQPLASVPIKIDQKTGAISLVG